LVCWFILRFARNALGLRACFKSDGVNNRAFFIEPMEGAIKSCLIAVPINSITEKHDGLATTDCSDRGERQFKCVVKLCSASGNRFVYRAFQRRSIICEVTKLPHITVKRNHFHAIGALKLLNKSNRRLLD
jgi:hypothetical protein